MSRISLFEAVRELINLYDEVGLTEAVAMKINQLRPYTFHYLCKDMPTVTKSFPGGGEQLELPIRD